MKGYNRRTIPEPYHRHEEHGDDTTALYLLTGIAGLVMVLLLVV